MVPETVSADLAARVLTAHGDVWQLQGRLRRAYGGGSRVLPGIRLMASGIAAAQWNNGDVVDAAKVDIDAVRNWYNTRAAGFGVPWGVRVASGSAWPHGDFIFTKRNMVLQPPAFRPAAPVPSTVLRRATCRDIDAIVAVDSTAFEDPPGLTRRWVEPQLGAAGFTTLVAEIDGNIVGIATAVETDEQAGPCVGIFGVAVAAAARRRGIAAALTSRLIEDAFANGVEMAHLNPNHEDAARIYSRLGFIETPGFDIYAAP